MEPSKCTILTDTQEGSCKITDVAQFFSEITTAYIQLKQSILYLGHNLPTYSPKQILAGCEKIRQQQNNISTMDQQMINIISLVGGEITHEPFVHDYRVAFARANMACSDLHQQLQAIKTTIQEAQKPT